MEVAHILSSMQVERKMVLIAFLRLFGLIAVTTSGDISLRFVEAGVPAGAATHVAEISLKSKGIHERFLPAGMSTYMKKLLWCTVLCERGPTIHDERDAYPMLTQGDQKWSEIRSLQVWSESQQKRIMASCVSRCREGKKLREEKNGVPALDAYNELPVRLQEYHAAVSVCIGAGSRPVSEVVTALTLCGVAHVSIGLFDVEFLQQLLDSYKMFRRGSSPMERVDRGRLRAGREEFWPPFQWPFNASQLLRPSWLKSLMQEYLGTDATFDYMTVLVAPAAGRESQDMHQDTQEMQRHVEIHVPLVDITPEMGPTVFCPGSQGIMQCSDAIKWYFFDLNCSGDSSLSYALPLRVGQVTLYDGTVFHGGSANLGQVDRPVLQLSWAANEESATRRNYAGKAFAGDSSRRQQLAIDIHKFRHAARSFDSDDDSIELEL